MVVVVPGLPKSRNGEQRIVGAAVLKLVGTAAKNVANRIDAPGGVMNNQNPYQAAHTKPRPTPSQLLVIAPSAAAGRINPKPIHRKYRRFSLKIFGPATVADIGSPVRKLVMKSPSMCECQRAAATAPIPEP